MTNDQDYEDWLKQAHKEWDADEMLEKLAKVSDIKPDKLKVLFGHLQNVLECGEMIEFLCNEFALPPDDAVGMYMGSNS